MSAYAARAPQKLLQAVCTKTAVHLNSYSTLCRWLLYCCDAIQSHPRGLPYVLFLLLYVAVCVHRAYPVYCRVLRTCHDNMYPDSPDRKIYATLGYHVPGIISYKYLWIVYVHICTCSSPGEAHHSFFFETCPPFASFVGFPFPVFIAGFPAF